MNYKIILASRSGIRKIILDKNNIKNLNMKDLLNVKNLKILTLNTISEPLETNIFDIKISSNSKDFYIRISSSCYQDNSKNYFICICENITQRSGIGNIAGLQYYITVRNVGRRWETNGPAPGSDPKPHTDAQRSKA